MSCALVIRNITHNVCTNRLQHIFCGSELQCVAVFYSDLQRVAVCCSVLQHTTFAHIACNTTHVKASSGGRERRRV